MLSSERRRFAAAAVVRCRILAMANSSKKGCDLRRHDATICSKEKRER